MCGRFTLRTPTSVLISQFRLATAPQWTPRYNIAPTQDVSVVRVMAGVDERDCLLMRWGLVPAWSQDTRWSGRMINARSETIAEKRAFQSAFRRRRCLVIADGYYEWKRQGGKKQPYLIHWPDDRPFAMAGLWETWRPGAHDASEAASSDKLHSCTIITTPSSRLTCDLHDRMPAILDPPDYDRWLDPSLTAASGVHEMLMPYESDGLRVDPVSTYVNNVRHEGPRCLQL